MQLFYDLLYFRKLRKTANKWVCGDLEHRVFLYMYVQINVVNNYNMKKVLELEGWKVSWILSWIWKSTYIT